MALAFGRPSADTVPLTERPFFHAASGRYYSVLQRAGRYFVRRHQQAADGSEINVEEKEIHYVLGSGKHSRSYLHRAPGGRLLELPLAWYSEKGGYWAMSPGYDRPRHDDFRRRVTYECVFCHNAYAELPPGADASGTAPVFPPALPEGIDCQRCHGPGRRHVESAQNRRPAAEVRSAILNPARLPRDRQLEICMQCHLETTSFPLPYAVRRFERGVFSFRPGERLSDYVLYFDHAPGTGHDDKFEIVSAAYRLRRSACFQKSAMTCTTCHDPHDAPRGAAAVARYTAACRGCHARGANPAAHVSTGNCLECHMPRRRAEDVVHVVMTDHWIQRRRPSRDLLAPLAERELRYRGGVAPYYPADPPEVYAAVAQVKQGSNLENGILRLERTIGDAPAGRPEFHFELARAYWASGRQEQALAAFEESLHRKPDYWPALREYGRALGKAGRLDRAAAILERAVSAEPGEAAAHNDLGLAYLRMGAAARALPALRRAVQIDPDFPEAWNNLGAALLQTGDRSAAASAYVAAIRAQPDYAQAQANLAELLAGDGRLDEARRHFESAVRLEAGYAEAWSGLGDVLAMQRQIGRAAACYRTALKLSPDLATAQLGLGAALATLGRAGEARPHLERAAASGDENIRDAARRALAAIGGPAR